MKSKKNDTLLRVLISFSVIGLIVYFLRDKLHHAANILRHDVQWTTYAVAAAIYFIVLILLAFRLKLIWITQNIKVPFVDVVRISFIGLFFSFFLPSAIGGDVAKIFYAMKHTKDKIKASTSIVVDRLMGFVAIMILALVALVFFSSDIKVPAIFYSIYFFSGVLGFSILFFASKTFANFFRPVKHLVPSAKIKQTINHLYHSIHSYKKHPQAMALTVALSVFLQCLVCVFYSIVCTSLGNSLPLHIFLAIVPITVIVSMAPSFGGLGVREAGAIYLFSFYMPQERALALTILVDIMVYGAGLLGGLVFAFFGHKDSKMLYEMETSS